MVYRQPWLGGVDRIGTSLIAVQGQGSYAAPAISRRKRTIAVAAFPITWPCCSNVLVAVSQRPSIARKPYFAVLLFVKFDIDYVVTG